MSITTDKAEYPFLPREIEELVESGVWELPLLGVVVMVTGDGVVPEPALL